MGCVCGKPSAVEDSRESPRKRQSKKGSSEFLLTGVTFSRREEIIPAEDGFVEFKDGVNDKKLSCSRRVSDEQLEKRRDFPGIIRVPKATEGEQVAAGWPCWLAEVAGEAIKGWLPRRADTFEKLDKIGQGTYSSVYKARDRINKKVVALKRVRFDNQDPESVKFMAREIQILRRLDHPNIIKLEGLVTSRTSCSLYLVFEYMEHDLTGLASFPGVNFTEPQIKCYMHQLLSGLEHCHSHGILHRDIKGSNLLIDNHGILKIADFGLATFFNNHQTLPMTSRVVTLWYRPPELLLGATHYGVSVDLWSTGCILGELYAGKPIMPGRTEVEQLHKIFKLCGSPSEDYWRKSKSTHSAVFKPLQPYKQCLEETFNDFPLTALSLMDTLLSIDPAHRGTAASALKSEFFTVKPLACDPSSMPKYPPSKEIDAKLRDEEARRQRAAGGKGQSVNQEKRGPTNPHANSLPMANAEFFMSIQRRQGNDNSKTSRSDIFNRHKEEVPCGLPVDPTRQTLAMRETSKDNSERIAMRGSHSGPLAPGVGRKAAKKCPEISGASGRPDLSTISGLVASRTLLYEECPDNKRGTSHSEALRHPRRLSESHEDLGSMTKPDHTHHIPCAAGTFRLESADYRNKEPIGHDHAAGGDKIHFSGPLLIPSKNVEQMLKDHERRIREAARRARCDRARAEKVEAQGKQINGNSLYVSSSAAR